MIKTIFHYADYKDYLVALVGPQHQRRGLKSKLAKAIGSQATFISQVIHGKANLSLEQADRINEFLGHTKAQAEYFFALVQKERAGTQSLRKHFETAIDELRAQQLNLTDRLGLKSKLTAESQARYYSSWHYAAIHIALTIEQLQSPTKISDFFKVPIGKVNSVLNFLVSIGLALRTEEGSYRCGQQTIRLGSDSSNILRHHANWRQLAIESLDREDPSDLHYSGVASLSKKDVQIIKEKILKNLEENLEVVRDSKEEELFCYSIDFFNLKR